MNHLRTRFERSAEGSFPYWVCLIEEKCTGPNYEKVQEFCRARTMVTIKYVGEPGKRVAMTETLTYVAIYLLIGWLIQQVEDAIASTEDKAGLEETVRRLGMMYGEPTLWDRFVGKLYLLKYIVGWPYYLLRRLILIGL